MKLKESWSINNKHYEETKIMPIFVTVTAMCLQDGLTRFFAAEVKYNLTINNVTCYHFGWQKKQSHRADRPHINLIWWRRINRETTWRVSSFDSVDVKGARACPVQRTSDTADILDGCKENVMSTVHDFNVLLLERIALICVKTRNWEI